LNMYGQVVGVDTAVASQAQNIGFAISITPALPIIEKLVRQGRIIRPSLGVLLYTIREGVVVTDLQPDGPAAQAGIKQYDIITKFAGQKISSASKLREAIISSHIGDKVEIVYQRDGKEYTTTAVLGETPPPK
jgi:serine protease Do